MEIISRAPQPSSSLIFRFLGISFTFFAMLIAYFQPFQADEFKNVPIFFNDEVSLRNSAFKSELFVEKISRAVAFSLIFHIATCFGYLGLVHLKCIVPDSFE